MTRLAPVAILALLTMLSNASIASAHVESYNQAKGLQAGPYLVFFSLSPTTPFAEASTGIVVQLSDASTGRPRTDLPVSVLVAGPEAFSARRNMTNLGDGRNDLIASITLPAPGNYSARIFVKNGTTGETSSADAEFEVFPNIPYRIRPADLAADVYTGQRTPLAFEVVDPVTLAPKSLADLNVRIEHWSDDHSTFLGAQDEPATRVGVGTWRIEPTLTESGMYHIRFASAAGGFNYAEVPLLHIYATSPQSAGIAEKDAPAAGILVLVAVVGVVALLRRR